MTIQRQLSMSMSMPMPMLLSLWFALVAITGMIASGIPPAEAFFPTKLPTTTTTAATSSTISTISTSSTSATTTAPLSTTLYVSRFNKGNGKETKKEGGGEESEEEMQRRMAVVRSLQMSFYGKDASKEDIPCGTPKTTGGVGGVGGDDNGDNGDNDNNGDGENSSTAGASSNTNSGYRAPKLDVSTGTISQLPLFRASWFELPGRSNILIIRDPVYTNMFERIFYTRKNEGLDGNSNSNSNSNNNSNSTTGSNLTPWVFGHLYTPEENEDQNEKAKKSKKHELMTWNGTHRNTGTTDSSLSSQAVLGTLLYIRDYRRFKDGRILALVQGAEKFVVEDVRQTLPYAVADVRILPDVEELALDGGDGGLEVSATNAAAATTRTAEEEDRGDPDSSPSSTVSSSVYSSDETDKDERFLLNCLRADEGTSARPARARAVFESIHSYHQFECDPHQRLKGMPNKNDLTSIDITYDAISKSLPVLCPTNTKNEVVTEDTTRMVDLPSLSSSTEAKTEAETETEPTPSLEFELLRRGITKIPPTDRRFNYITEPTYSSSSGEEDGQTPGSSRSWTTEELEYELWLVLDHFSEATKKTITPILLELLPSEDNMPKPWPSGFRFKKMLEESDRKSASSSSTTTSSSSSSSYPNHKRQRRFSYSAAYLLESVLPLREGSEGKSGSLDKNEIQEFRALLLSIPSTRQRLRVVLETFHRWRLYQEWDEFA